MNLELEFKIKSPLFRQFKLQSTIQGRSLWLWIQKLLGQGRERKVAGLRYGFTNLSLSPSSVQPNQSICIPLSNQYTQEAEEWIWESEMAQEFSESSSSLKKKLVLRP